MPYELYWHGSLNAFWEYREKFIIESKRMAEERNATAWLNGLYIQNAVAAIFSNKTHYPKEPIKLTEPKTEGLNPDVFRVYMIQKNQQLKTQLIASKKAGEQIG